MTRTWRMATLALCCAQPACSSDEGACERIIEACHDADDGAGAAHDCHELAEGGATDESCAEKEDDCLEACGH